MPLDAKVSALTAQLKSEFWKGWDQVGTPMPWEGFTTIIPSTTRIENYLNYSPTPSMSLWRGHRSYAQVDSFVQSIRNEMFHTEIKASLDDVEDDQTGGLVAQSKYLVEKAKGFPGRAGSILMGQSAGGSVAGKIPIGASVNSVSDGLPMFSNRTAATPQAFGTGNNSLQFQAATGTGSYNLVAMFTGNSIIKAIGWQARSGPEFRTNSGDNQSSESREIRWWVDRRGAIFWGFWFHAVLMKITNLPNVAEMHLIYAAIETAFRSFQYPATTGSDIGEYPHEQTDFNSGNLQLVGSTGLGEVLRQSLSQDWAPQTVGATTVPTTNSYKGWAKYLVNNLLNA